MLGALLVAGCTEPPPSVTLTATNPPSAQEANALVQQQLTALGANPDLCLKDFSWPVTEVLTWSAEGTSPDVTSSEDRSLLQDLETVGLVKGVVVSQAAQVNQTAVQLYSVRYSLTPAAAPWVKEVNSPDFTQNGSPVPHKALCFGKLITTHIHVVPVILDARGSQATAWKNNMDNRARAYVSFTEGPDHSFEDAEAAIRQAAQRDVATGNTLHKQHDAFERLRDRARAYPGRARLYLIKDGDGAWQALTDDAAAGELYYERDKWPATAED